MSQGMPRIWGTRVEARAMATEAEVRRSVAKPERLRTQVELMGGRSPTEPSGWSDEAQPEERSPEAMAGRCPTKAELEGRGSSVEPLDLRAEAESLPRRLVAEVRDTTAPGMLEDGRPMGLTPNR